MIKSFAILYLFKDGVSMTISFDQVYKIMEVNPAKEGFVIKFKMKKSPVQGRFKLAKDFRLYTRNTVYLVRQDPG